MYITNDSKYHTFFIREEPIISSIEFKELDALPAGNSIEEARKIYVNFIEYRKELFLYLDREFVLDRNISTLKKEIGFLQKELKYITDEEKLILPELDKPPKATPKL